MIIFKDQRKKANLQSCLGFQFHQSKLLFCWNIINNLFKCRRTCQETSVKMESTKWNGSRWLSLRLILLKALLTYILQLFYGEGFFVIVTSTPTIIIAEKRPRRIDFLCRSWVSLFRALTTVYFPSLSHAGSCRQHLRPELGVWARALLVGSQGEHSLPS